VTRGHTQGWPRTGRRQALAARESGEAQECGPGSAQSAGMQESVGERRRVQASVGKYWKATGNCENHLFIGQGESRRIIVIIIFTCITICMS